MLNGKYTEEDLDNLINKVLDEQSICKDLPNVCSIISTESGRVKAFNAVKSMVLDDGITDIMACLAQIECAADEQS